MIIDILLLEISFVVIILLIKPFKMKKCLRKKRSQVMTKINIISQPVIKCNIFAISIALLVKLLSSENTVAKCCCTANLILFKHYQLN